MVDGMTLRVDEKMESVLETLAERGFATTGMLIDETDLTRPTLAKRLDKLHAAGAIEYVHEPTALWELVDDPREAE
jgi:DNA-binding MarR family transcriptional regulator